MTEKLINEMLNLFKGNDMRNLNNHEAANRLAIGTQHGAFHKIAIKLNGFSEKKFIKAKEIFTKIAERSKLVGES